MSDCSMLNKKRAFMLLFSQSEIHHSIMVSIHKTNIDHFELVKCLQSKGAHWICGSEYIPSFHMHIRTWTISFALCYEQLQWCPL